MGEQKGFGEIQSDGDLERETEEEREREKAEGEAKEAEKMIRGDQIEEITALQDELREKISMPILLGHVKKKYGASRLEDITEEQGVELITLLKNKRKQKQAIKPKEREILVTTDKGDFKIHAIGEGKYEVQHIGSKDTHVTIPKEPFCDCGDWTINKRRRELCKHLEACDAAGIKVAPISEQLAVVPSTELIMSKPLSVEMISDVTKKIVDPRAITEIAKDGIADGVLYDNTPIGPVVKEDFSAMLARMNNIVSEIVKLEYEEIKKYNGEPILLVRATARATHLPTGSSLTRSASVIMDFKRIEKETSEKSEGRTFADRIAESDSCRRSELALMGIPEKVLVPMIKKALEPYRKI